MKDGLVLISQYGDEFSARNAKQFLVDNGIAAEVFTGGLILYTPQYDLFAPAEKEDKARELLKEFEADAAAAADQEAEGEQDEFPEADCEGKGE
jgi:hypothetical protein